MLKRKLIFIAAAIGCVVIVVAAWFGSVSWYTDSAADAARDRARFYRATLRSSLERFEHLPFVLAKDPFVIDAAVEGSGDSINARLEDFARESGADAIYLMNRDGLTIAASNWREPQSFLGQSYAFRPYFIDAFEGKKARFFAIGATTSEPGYFIAESVNDVLGEPVGVVAVKVDLRPMEDSWREGGETAFVVDANGVIVLSSQETWQYRTVDKLTDVQRSLIERQRQFADEPLLPLRIEDLGTSMRIDSANYVSADEEVGRLGWHVRYLTPSEQIAERARLVIVVVAATILAAIAALLTMRSKRMGRALVDSERDAQELRGVNDALSKEIEERRIAEERLQVAQRELRRKGQLAALGQLSASVSHELSQPLAAMKTQMATMRIEPPSAEEHTQFLTNMEGLTDRMIGITKQMKSFATKPKEARSVLDLRDILTSSLAIVNPQFDSSGITVQSAMPGQPVAVKLEALRIEQVVVNLLKNAMDAVLDAPEKTVAIEMFVHDGAARLVITDSGDGLTEEARNRLFEPFYTTKASGDGLGLGLAISAQIVDEFGGQLTGKNASAGGAVFTLDLPLHEAIDEEEAA